MARVVGGDIIYIALVELDNEVDAMTANQMIELMNRSPFAPLEIHLSDGSMIRVEHPYEVATKPNSAICIVYDGDLARFVSFRNITEIVTSAVNGSSKTSQ